MRGQSEMMIIALAFMIIGVLALASVLRARDPFQQPEVKSLSHASDVAAFLNILSLQDSGSAVLDLKGTFDVKVEYKDGRYVAGVKAESGKDFREASIAFYPASARPNLEKSFAVVQRVCIKKSPQQEFAEVTMC